MKSNPLAGIPILELRSYISALDADITLGSLRAEVVKIKPFDGENFSCVQGDRSGYCIQYRTRKKSVALKLKYEALNLHFMHLSILVFGSEVALMSRPWYDSIGQNIAGLYSIMNDPDIFTIPNISRSRNAVCKQPIAVR